MGTAGYELFRFEELDPISTCKPSHWPSGGAKTRLMLAEAHLGVIPGPPTTQHNHMLNNSVRCRYHVMFLLCLTAIRCRGSWTCRIRYLLQKLYMRNSSLTELPSYLVLCLLFLLSQPCYQLVSQKRAESKTAKTKGVSIAHPKDRAILTFPHLSTCDMFHWADNSQ